MRRMWLGLGVVWLAAACAHPKPVSPNPAIAELARADAAVREGCYDCLIEARDIYARVGVGPIRRFVVSRLFETELLIALREKELNLPGSTASLGRARAIGAELPPSAEADRYLALVEAVPDDDVGRPRAVMRAFRIAHTGYVAKVNGEVAWLRESDEGVLRKPARDYLALAIDCSYLSRPRQAGQAPPRVIDGVPPIAPDAPPLVTYRVGLCVSINKVRMEATRTAAPRFVDTSLFLGRMAVSNAKNDGGRAARELMAEAYAHFPKSSSTTYLLGNLNQQIGDCREALKYYDETVALESLHEDALLGRVICLTYLKRTDEAMAAATHLIGLKLDNLSDALYWRAWNQDFMLKAYPGARADIEAAKAIRATIQIYTLAGIIEHDQDDLVPAEKDLTIAVHMPDGSRQCIAWWYLGLVGMKRKAWLESGRAFDTAMGCYEQDEKDAREGLAAITARTDLDEAFRARQITGFEAAIVEAQHQKYAAAFNAANYFATGGEYAKAKAMVELAAPDESLAEKVAILRDFLKNK